MRTGRGVIDGIEFDREDRREGRGGGLRLLTALCALAIAYGSLIPFQFDIGRFARAAEFGALQWRGAGLEDIVTNLAVYVPLGALIAGSSLRRRGRTSSFLATAILGAALSVSLELAQTALPARVSSLTDVALNVGGALFGAMLTSAAGTGFRSLAHAARNAIARRPWHAAVTGLTVGLLLLEIMPFDFITAQPAFEDALRRAEWNPFQLTFHIDDVARSGPNLHDLHLAAAFALLGYLACFASLERGRTPAAGGAFGVAHVVVVTGLIEVLQLFTASHSLELASGLIRCFTGWLGVWTAMALGARLRAVSNGRGVAVSVPAAGVAMLVVIEAMTAGGAIWLFHSPVAIIDVAYSTMPFESMWRGSMSHALADAVALVAGAGALSVSLLFLLKSIHGGLRAALVAGATGSLSLLVEVAEALSRGSACDVTSVIVAMATASLMCLAFPHSANVGMKWEDARNPGM